MSKTTTIRIIQPSSRGGEELLDNRIRELKEKGFNTLYTEVTNSSRWPYAAVKERRLKSLISALEEKESQVLLCARGGYGASDLLPYLPWTLIKELTHKWIVGFSDITAIHSAFWSILKWPGIHGPMPCSYLWNKHSSDDTDFLLNILGETPKKGHIKVEALKDTPDQAIDGWLFGGCLSVLSNLIGTPYFPKSLEGSILFLEETGENPGRIARYWNQFCQSGVLKGVRGVVWGHLRGLESDLNSCEVKMEMAVRSQLPTWSSEDFGHLSPNWSLGIGSSCVIDDKQGHLKWWF